MKPASLKLNRGFTLVELLVVTAISGIVVSIIAACLIGGMRVWDRSRTFNEVEAESVIGLGIIEKDLMNSIGFFDIPFSGSDGVMSFPGLVAVTGETAAESQVQEERIGTIKYAFDSGKGALLRKTWVYPGAEPESVLGERIIGGASSVSIRYGRTADDGSVGEWLSQWTEPTNWPDRVRIDAVFARDSASVNITRTVLVPVKRGGAEK